MSDLLPCPFCRGKAHLFCDDFINGVPRDNPDWVIECEGDCECRFSMEDQDMATLIAAWNRRAPMTLAAALALPEIKALVDAVNGEHGYCNDDPTCPICAAIDALLPALRRIVEGGE